VKILVTGSNGLLGQKLVERCLKESNIEVVATSAGPNRNTAFNLIYHTLDITNSEEVEKVLSQLKPDVVINTAAMTNVDQCEEEKEKSWQINVEGVRNVVKSCLKTGSFLLHLSTDFIFDGTKMLLDEEDKPNPINYYGETKLESEKIIRNSKISWAIARTVLVYGYTKGMNRSNIILWIKNKLELGERINLVDDQWRTPTIAEDLAEGCYLIAIKKATGIWNISGNELLTPYQMAIQVADYFKLDKELIGKTDSETFRQKATRPLKTGFSIEKAEKKLGYAPHSLLDGIGILAKQLE